MHEHGPIICFKWQSKAWRPANSIPFVDTIHVHRPALRADAEHMQETAYT